MRDRDNFDASCSFLALLADFIAVCTGVLAAYWVGIHTDWLRPDWMPDLEISAFDRKAHRTETYSVAAILTAIIYCSVFHGLGLYQRPQSGRYGDRIPRIFRACTLSFFGAIALSAIARTETPLSRMVIATGFATTFVLVVLEKNILFQLERHWAKHSAKKRSVVIVGCTATAVKLIRAIEREPRRRARVVAVFRTTDDAPDPAIQSSLLIGRWNDVESFISEHSIDELIVADPDGLPHDASTELILSCMRNMTRFQMVEDTFRMLTSRVESESVDGIPLLRAARWPLEFPRNRILKRVEDVVGSLVGITLCSPIVLISALLVRMDSPGSAFFSQERCGRGGQRFTIFKLRTMQTSSGSESDTRWTVEDDPRRTVIGKWLRKWNIDELPQLWNVLRGEMSLVGPRPERPYYVEQFREEIDRYMWRHIYKPGMTGWAQVNGLRGDTSIRNRIEKDLEYLEKWSLAFDFKILWRTVFGSSRGQ